MVIKPKVEMKWNSKKYSKSPNEGRKDNRNKKSGQIENK